LQHVTVYQDDAGHFLSVHHRFFRNNSENELNAQICLENTRITLEVSIYVSVGTFPFSDRVLFETLVTAQNVKK